MSLLLFTKDEAGAAIFTDTLATTDDGVPLLYTSKCAVIPHLAMAVTGTGVLNLISPWMQELQSSAVARGIDMLDDLAPDALRRLWNSIDRPLGPAGVSATLYHIGYSEESAECVGYVYRSIDNFESEPMQRQCMAIKPEPEVIPDPLPATLEDMIALAVQLRDEYDRQPPGERIHIGGDLVLTGLQNGGTFTGRVHRFDDFESDWEAMTDRLPLVRSTASR